MESGEVATELLEKNNKAEGNGEIFEKKMMELEPEQKDGLDGGETKGSAKHENKTSSEVRNRNRPSHFLYAPNIYNYQLSS